MLIFRLKIEDLKDRQYDVRRFFLLSRKCSVTFFLSAESTFRFRVIWPRLKSFFSFAHVTESDLPVERSGGSIGS